MQTKNIGGLIGMDIIDELSPQTIALLDSVRDHVKDAAINELVLRLCGLSNEALALEVCRLTTAIIKDMSSMGTAIGLVEKTVVLATMRVAVVKVRSISIGRA